MRGTPEEREADVWRVLERVTDPELDEPITEMGFVEACDVTAGEVLVADRKSVV